jgi:hypothetical protein
MAESATAREAMSGLAFLSPTAARADSGFEPRGASPLARALEGASGIRDLSLFGKLEVRGPAVGDLGTDVEVLPITPTRTLVVGPPERCVELRVALPGFVIDVSAALAGIAVEDERLMRRLTDLDLAALPSAGKVSGVGAVVAAGEGGFRIFFAQEYGHSVVEAVRDLQAGLA